MVFMLCPNQKLEDHPFSAVQKCFYNISGIHLQYIWKLSPRGIHNKKMHHAMDNMVNIQNGSVMFLIYKWGTCNHSMTEPTKYDSLTRVSELEGFFW
jgi:hypothetical protein